MAKHLEIMVQTHSVCIFITWYETLLLNMKVFYSLTLSSPNNAKRLVDSIKEACRVRLEFTNNAWEDYQYWLEQDKTKLTL